MYMYHILMLEVHVHVTPAMRSTSKVMDNYPPSEAQTSILPVCHQCWFNPLPTNKTHMYHDPSWPSISK